MCCRLYAPYIDSILLHFLFRQAVPLLAARTSEPAVAPDPPLIDEWLKAIKGAVGDGLRGKQLRVPHTAYPRVMKIFSHLQTPDQSQKVQNDKSSRGNVEPKIFVGGNGIFSIFSF